MGSSKANRIGVVVGGHGLLNEGAAYDSAGRRKFMASRLGTSGDGHGKCRCGALSPTSLPSGGARKRWHKTHKAEVLAAKAAN